MENLRDDWKKRIEKMKLKKQQYRDLIDLLKKDTRFRILRDNQIRGFGDGVDYWSYTEFESPNLRVVYAEHNLFEESDITITDKTRNVYAFSDATEENEDKPIACSRFVIEDVKKYIAENA
jgi:hypothetical protein